MKQQTDILGSAWMVVAAVFFTIMGILAKLAAREFGMNHYELVFWRVIFAVSVLGVQAALMKRSFRTAYPKEHFWRGLAGTGGLVMAFYGITHLPLGTAVTLTYTSAVFLALLSVLILREWPNGKAWLGLLLGFAGITVLMRPVFHSGQAAAALVTLGSGLCSGYAYLQVRELARLDEPGWRIVFYFSLTAAIVSAWMASLSGWRTPDVHSLPYIFGLGLSAMLGQLALTRAYAVGRKFTVAALSYLTVLFSALYGVLYLGEPFGWQEALGMAVIVLAGIVSSLR